VSANEIKQSLEAASQNIASGHFELAAQLLSDLSTNKKYPLLQKCIRSAIIASQLDCDSMAYHVRLASRYVANASDSDDESTKA
jgi:hypothetical protein